ncbi:MAG: hypothetical protein WBL61_01505 [Bryobacteraceae bacterium]
MHMLIRLRGGSPLKALVLARTRTWMRVAAAGLDDAVELRLYESSWLDESNEPVQFCPCGGQAEWNGGPAGAGQEMEQSAIPSSESPAIALH